ncbi:30S ribosomal protein S13 [Candidatus Nasuia deltocephalinicola]|uniref:30S ribosomal protein S13 n=1 Tax=Candidatus Nasuia deltocephalincola TaxID=1160784 RepID=UPI00216B1907|nr:30S ribosomal protein S13 [Candidatus Nasuia deltocephalinicola]
MITIKNYNFSENKNIYISLTYIYGIGSSRSKYICKSLNINFYKKNKDLTEIELKSISNKISLFKTGDFLKKIILNNIKSLKYIKCYRGIRHEKNLPVRGQNTKNNARTRKGPRKLIFLKKKINVKKQKKKK